MAILVMFSTCTDPSITKEFQNIQTQQVDPKEYDLIKTTFGFWEVDSASKYIGGLNSDYQFAYAHAMCGNESYCVDSEWQYGGLICTCKNIVIKDTEGYKIIKSRAEFKLAFAPIETREEALGYAIVISGNYPVFDENYFKDEFRYFNGKPGTTRVQEFDDHYLIQLFDYATFGCDHPYYSVLIRVDKNGDVSEYRRQKSFEDPEDDALCID